MSNVKPVPGTNGNQYIPYDQRTGEESVVYFTRDLSAAGLKKIYDRIQSRITGKTGIKLHTGEKNGPNIIPRPWVKELMADKMDDAVIVETNTYYEGDRYTTEQHRETLKVNGWTFCPVDIMDKDGTAMLPVKNGKWFTEMSVGRNLLNYESLLVLTHFKGHVMGGFGGSNKNIGIGCADGRIGKAMIHTVEGSDNMWSIAEEELMERIAEKLSEIEMTARSIVDGAQEQKHQMEMKMQKQRDTFDADMEKETNEKILKIQSDLATNMEKLLKKQEEQNNNEIESLKQDFKEHRSEYARQILERVIKV